MMEGATILQQRYTIGVAPELLMLLLFLKTYAVVVIDIPKINCVEEALLYSCIIVIMQVENSFVASITCMKSIGGARKCRKLRASSML